MRIRILYSLALLFFYTFSLGQVTASLPKDLLPTSNKEKEIDLYLQLADSLIWADTDLDKGQSYAQKVIDICSNYPCETQGLVAKGLLANVEISEGNYSTVEDVILPYLEENHSDTKAIIPFFQELAGYYFLVNGDNTAANTHLLKAQEYLEKNNPTSKRLGKVYYYLGFSHNIGSSNEKSIAYLRKTVKHFTVLDDKFELLEAKSGLSTLLASDGQHGEAIRLLIDAIEIAEKNDIQGLTRFALYESLMDIYIRNGDYEKAEARFHEIMPGIYEADFSIEEKAGDLWSLHMTYAKLMGKVNRPEEGLRHVDSSYVYSSYLNDFCDRITDLRKIGLLVNCKKYELAEINVHSLLAELKSYGEMDAMNAVIIGQLAKIYTNSPIRPKRKLINELLPTIDRILAKNENQYNLDALDAEQLSTIFGIYLGDSNRALEGFSKVTRIKDTLQQHEQIKATNELIIQYETKEKEKLIEIQRLELAKKTSERNLLIGLVLAAIFAGGIVLLLFQQKQKYAQHLEVEVNKRTAELRKTNQELHQSKEELERYNYIASHDLKEPLRNVVSFVNIIKRKRLVTDEGTINYFNHIEKGAIQMHKIVQDLVNFSNLKSYEIKNETIEVLPFMEEIQEELEGANPVNLSTITTKHFPKYIHADKTVLHLVFKNLIENGLKFNENNLPFVNIEYYKEGEEHNFKFIDNGIGIEEIYHERIFELFKRLNNRSAYVGSGVGLAICKKLLSQIKGDITLESNLHGGTTFMVTIPALIASI